MWDSSEQQHFEDVALVGRRWSSGITLSSGELSTLLLVSEEMSGPCFKMGDNQQLIDGEAMKSPVGPVGDIIKDCCTGPSLTGVLNCILLLLILVAVAIISLQSQGTKQTYSAGTQGHPQGQSNIADSPQIVLEDLQLFFRELKKIGLSLNPVCPVPYTLVMGECFYVQNVFTFTYTQAQEYCSAMGGQLAEPKTAQRLLSFQVDVLGPLKQRQSYWIGGSDPDGDGQFNWLSGRPVDKSEWQQGMPSEIHWNRRCLRYYLAGNMCGVADAKCSDGMNAICEYIID